MKIDCVAPDRIPKNLPATRGLPRFVIHLSILALLLFSAGGATLLADHDDQDIHQTVARISFVYGDVSFSRGDDPDEWQSCDINTPMTLGDRLYSGDDGRLELQISGGNYVRIGAGTDFSALNMTEETKQFSITEGVASFQIRRFDWDEVLEVDTPNAAVTFEQAGRYRIAVDPEGNSRIGVIRGRATVSAGGGEVTLQAGEEMVIEGLDEPWYDIVSVGPPDRFDGWVTERERRLSRVTSYRYVSPDIIGAEDLDGNGRWVRMPEYGMVWTPTVVQASWTPYSQGHWVWQDPWGWTWIAAEPWGWAPCHYGRWFRHQSRWYWSPVPPSVRRVPYAPALVAFVGGGSRGGVSVSVSVGSGGAIGWFPLGPRDPLIPWWGSRRPIYGNDRYGSRADLTVNNTTINNTNINVTNVKYVNKTYVTVVNNNTFISGGSVQNNIVRDQTVIRQVNEAPVVAATQALPVPTRASLRVAAETKPVKARPNPKASRKVVARIAPPPEPPRFEKKQQLIEANKGAPVAPADATRLAIQEQGKEQARVPVQAVAERQGEVKLKARGKGKGAERAPQPVRAVRGRPMATPEKPVQADQTPPAETPQSVAPTGAPARKSVEGREGRKPMPPNRREPPPSAQPPAADPNQAQRQNEQGTKPEDQRGKSKSKKRKGAPPEKDPNAPTP